jgi:monoamine oxidase
MSGETWQMHRTGFLSTYLPAMPASHGRMLFAGSDIANGWGGFIEGAIESGMEAACAAVSMLENRQSRV